MQVLQRNIKLTLRSKVRDLQSLRRRDLKQVIPKGNTVKREIATAWWAYGNIGVGVGGHGKLVLFYVTHFGVHPCCSL